MIDRFIFNSNIGTFHVLDSNINFYKREMNWKGSSNHYVCFQVIVSTSLVVLDPPGRVIRFDNYKGPYTVYNERSRTP